MTEQPRWLVETKWTLSSAFTILAILAVFWGLTALGGSYVTPPSTSQQLSANDRLGMVLTWAMVLPVALIVLLPLYFLAGLLAFRLLVPTFAGVPPRLVGVLCTIWGVGMGALYLFPDPLPRLELTTAGAIWGLLMPLPNKTLLDYGPVPGGVVIGLGLATLSWTPGGLIVTVIWTAWRLYRRHAWEVVATGLTAASLPGLLVLRDPSSIAHGTSTAVAALLIAMLLALAVGAMVMATARPEEEPETEPEP
jgi:hypothetical protein